MSLAVATDQWYHRYMVRRQGFVFALKTNEREATMLRQFAGCCRFVWNDVLALNDLRHERGDSRMGYSAACGYLASLKTEHAWLRDAHSQPLQQTLKDLERAYSNAFDPKLRARFPAFKKRGRQIGIRFPQGFNLTNNAVYLPKLGWIGYRASRAILGVPKSVTVYEKAGRWYISVLAEREVDVPQHPSQSVIGIDLGVNVFAALSNGEMHGALTPFARLKRKVAHVQRKLSRQTKFSRNWRKTRARISRLHVRIANVRDDANNKLSTMISKNHAIVCIEDLRVVNMTASARGTAAKPGKNVAQKSGLNRAILDQGWAAFGRMLGYKLAWSGGLLIRVDPRNTSRECPACGHISSENRPSQERFLCMHCGRTENADFNAAINIRNRGLVLIQGGTSPGAPVERSTSAAKQETRSGHAA
jgi:putative transposase